MKRLLAGLLTSAVGLSLSGCGPATQPVPGPPFEVLVLDRLPDATNSTPAPFALQRRTLVTYTDLAQLSSPVFRVRQGGTSDVAASSDLIRGVITGGFAPNLRYVIEDGVVVPRDDDTLAMLSTAFQFENIFPALVDSTSSEVRASFETNGPMDIFFGTSLKAGPVSARLKANAFFNGLGWQFGIAVTSPFTKVPLGAEGRVIAHELGHGVFQVVFFGGRQPCDKTQAAAHASDAWFPGRLDSELAIGGVNEGFADWVSFAVTGGTNPIEVLNVGDSLPNSDLQRSVVADTFQWRDILKPDAPVYSLGCEGKYCLGTLFARSLVATYLSEGHVIEDEQARHVFSRAVVGALGGTMARMRDLPLPLPAEDVARCSERDEVSLELDPPIIGAYLGAFLEGLEPARATKLCQELVRRFQEGFPESFRNRCAP